MNTRNDNPNVIENKCCKDTKFRIIRDSGSWVAQKRENEGEWEDLKRYRNVKNDYVRATFVTVRKAKRFITKLEINAEEND